MIKYPVRIHCETISDCEWFYNNYKHLYESNSEALEILSAGKNSIRTEGKYQITIGGEDGFNSKIGSISGCIEICENKNCHMRCRKIMSLPLVKAKNLRREEKLKRILK